MNIEKLEELLIDYIDGKLTGDEKQQVEQMLTQNEEAFKLYEQLTEVIRVINQSAPLMPSSKLKMEFDQLIQSEIASAKNTKTIFFQPAFYRVAAAVALLVVGGGIG